MYTPFRWSLMSMYLNSKWVKNQPMGLFLSALIGFAWLVEPVFAQSQSSIECLSRINNPGDAVRQVALRRSWDTDIYNGLGGVDTFIWKGPGHFSPRPQTFLSMEIIDTQNGAFDTVIVNGETILGTERGELELITDWYDQIILDPRLRWDRTIDDAFTGQIFRSKSAGGPVLVRTALDAYVVEPPSMALQTPEGPLGVFSLEHVPGAQAQSSVDSPDGQVVELAWPNAGRVEPNLESLRGAGGRVILNTENRASNAVVIDVAALMGRAPRQIVFTGDMDDRLVMLQEECWEISDAGELGQKQAVFNAGKPNEITLFADRQHLRRGRNGTFTLGSAGSPNYRHLSADVNYVLDAIDLRNNGRDILIIRNDARLRSGFPVIVDGDEGVDEIWLEGSAGWRFEYQNYGLVATVPNGPDSQLILAFAPGLKVGILPTPPFLNNPALLSLPAYPGTRDEPSDHTRLFVTRGGFVNFSAQQLAGKSVLDLKNGIGNVLRLSSENLANVGEDLLIIGDNNQDTILSDGLPEMGHGPQGRIVWHIERPNGKIQRITARGISFVQYPTDNNLSD